MLPKDAQPRDEVSFSYQESVIASQPSLAVRLDAFGVEIYSGPLRPNLTEDQIAEAPSLALAPPATRRQPAAAVGAGHMEAGTKPV